MRTYLLHSIFFALSLSMIMFLSACGAEQNTSSTSVATTAPAHVAIATKPPTETPTPTIVEDTGPAVLGALLGAFVTKYGTADLSIEGSPRFALYGIQNNLGLELEATNTGFTQRVILVEAGQMEVGTDRLPSVCYKEQNKI